MPRSKTPRRVAILAIHHRKVAKHAQLFPIFHTFETAFRSLVAVELEALYVMADWRRPIFNVVRKGDQAESITQIKGITLSRSAVRRIGEIIYAIEGINLQRNEINDGYEFAELCDLSHISSLITNHWSHFSPRYFNIAPRVMTQQESNAKFAKVRDARNDIYHHKSLARITNVVATAEELFEATELLACLRLRQDRRFTGRSAQVCHHPSGEARSLMTVLGHQAAKGAQAAKKLARHPLPDRTVIASTVRYRTIVWPIGVHR